MFFSCYRSISTFGLVYELILIVGNLLVVSKLGISHCADKNSEQLAIVILIFSDFRDS